MCETCDKKSIHKPRKRRILKRKKNECPDNERKKEEPPKCPKPKRPSVKAKKCLTTIEKIMLRIQPPIADRERYLHPYHVNCFLEESERVPIKKPICGPCPSKRKQICREGELSLTFSQFVFHNTTLFDSSDPVHCSQKSEI